MHICNLILQMLMVSLLGPSSKLSIHVVQVLCTLKAVVGFVQLLHVTLDAMLVNQGTLWPCLGLDRVAFLNPDHGHQQTPHIPPP